MRAWSKADLPQSQAEPSEDIENRLGFSSLALAVS